MLEIVSNSVWFMDALRAARALDLPAWCIGAGALRNLVWDTLHGHAQPSALSDIDLAWFDASHSAPQCDRDLQRRLPRLSIAPWEVTNQAHVHRWFEGHFGHAVAPLASLHEAVASWPEFATSVGVWLDARDDLRLITPYGLDDLLGMVVRRNPARVDVATYRMRTTQKRYAERWPRVRVFDA
ncbi:nucleotidyltransferase family protein [Luteimonas sp. 3794]|uniref:nucleotidyltransferase family protein n=1 Tax=Luteimonas sp. 3794 TaxID=2817730 RepID=UPI002862107B|nr:nucleotidyltransferase family protein [Luteimonas sp. 3794]MDR6993067.1 hypothetical protein [Luteimonas sp. 3794]